MQNTFDGGSVLGRSFGILVRRFPTFGVLGILLYAPFAVATVYVTQHEIERVEALYAAWDPETEPEPVVDAGFFSASVLGILLVGTVSGAMVTAALTYGVFEALRGRHVSVGRCLYFGLSKTFPVLLISIALAFMVGVGCLLLVVPGLIIATTYYVAVPAFCIEGGAPTTVFQRSAELTDGHRWHVFLILFVVVGVPMFIDTALSRVFQEQPFVYLGTSITATILFGVWAAIASAVAYYDLRNVGENFDLESLTDVFA